MFHAQESVSADRIVKIASPVNTICWNLDGNLFAIGEKNAVVVRDAHTYRTLYELPLSNAIELIFSHEHGKETSSGSDILLGVSPKYIDLWDLSQTSSKEARTDFNYLVPLDDGSYITTAAISKTSNYFAAAADDGSITLYQKLRLSKELSSRCLERLEGYDGRIRSLLFSPDNSLVSSVSDNATIRIWKTADGHFVTKLDISGGLPIPAVFSSDSNHIFVSTSRNVVSLMDFSGKIIKKIKVKPLRQFTVSSDDRTLITLTEDGMFEFYDVESGILRGHIPSFTNSELVSFAFNSDYTQLLTGHKDGSVYKLNVNDILLKKSEDSETESIDESAPKSTQEKTDSDTDDSNESLQSEKSDTNGNSESSRIENINETGRGAGAGSAYNSRSQTYAPFDFQSSLRQHFSAFNIGASAIMLDKKSAYYQFGTAAEFGWYTTMFTAPVYEGLSARFAMAFPADNYPMTYKTLDGSGRIAPPYLFFGELFVPVGVEVQVSQFVSLISEMAFEVKVNFLMNPGVTSSKQMFSLGGRIRTGVVISKLAVMLGAEYDSMWGLIPEISLMANFKVKSKGGKK